MRRFSLVLALMLAYAGVVCADLAVTPAPAARPAVVAASQDAAGSTVHGTAWNGVSRSGLLDGNPWASLPTKAEAGDDLSLRELPGLPNSSSLFLSAMLSVGAWHAARRAGHVHLASLPDWYHSDAPHQVGHSVAFDPVTGFAFLPACIFDRPVEAGLLLLKRKPGELPVPLLSQRSHAIEAPRGPPYV